jgi:hypothetical protein
MSGYLLILGTTTHKISGDLVARVETHCTSPGTVSQVMVDIEDAYVRWSDEVFCKGTGLAECPCVEVQKSLWTAAGWKDASVFKDR